MLFAEGEREEGREDYSIIARKLTKREDVNVIRYFDNFYISDQCENYNINRTWKDERKEGTFRKR